MHKMSFRKFVPAGTACLELKQLVFAAVILGLLIMPLGLQARSFARWHTSLGSFTAELYDEIVPITANNFIDLTNAGFYNNLIFHRVVQGFVIQDGCPYGTGYGGPGYTIPDEFSPLLNHDQAGILAMAHSSAPNSAGSQYYLTLAPQPHLDGDYAVFGKVIEGLNTVMTIGDVPVGANDRPITPVNIYQLRMLDLHIVSTFPAEDTLYVAQDEPQMFIIEATAQTAQLSYDWYLDEIMILDQHDFILETTINSPGWHALRCHIASTDSIAYDAQWVIHTGTAVEDNTLPGIAYPTLKCYPNPFGGALELEYCLKAPAEVAIEIYNLKGQKVTTLHSGPKAAGTWKAGWDSCDTQGARCAPGMYLILLHANNITTAVKAILVND